MYLRVFSLCRRSLHRTPIKFEVTSSNVNNKQILKQDTTNVQRDTIDAQQDTKDTQQNTNGTQTDTKDLLKQEDKSVSRLFPKFKVIFIFPYIKYHSAVNLIKCHITILSGVSILATLMLIPLKFTTWEHFIAIAFSGIPATLALHFVGLYFNYTVAFIYKKPDEYKIKISYLTYWGNRKNIDVKMEDISLFSDETAPYLKNYFYCFRVAKDKKLFKVFVKHGEILDETSFKNIFGYENQ